MAFVYAAGSNLPARTRRAPPQPPAPRFHSFPRWKGGLRPSGSFSCWIKIAPSWGKGGSLFNPAVGAEAGSAAPADPDKTYGPQKLPTRERAGTDPSARESLFTRQPGFADPLRFLTDRAPSVDMMLSQTVHWTGQLLPTTGFELKFNRQT